MYVLRTLKVSFSFFHLARPCVGDVLDPARIDRRIGDKANGGCAFDRAGSPAHRCRARHGGQAGRERVHARQQHQGTGLCRDDGRHRPPDAALRPHDRSAQPRPRSRPWRVRHRRRNSRLGAVASRMPRDSRPRRAPRRKTRWSAPPIGTPPSGSSHRRCSRYPSSRRPRPAIRFAPRSRRCEISISPARARSRRMRTG